MNQLGEWVKKNVPLSKEVPLFSFQLSLSQSYLRVGMFIFKQGVCPM